MNIYMPAHQSETEPLHREQVEEFLYSIDGVTMVGDDFVHTNLWLSDADALVLSTQQVTERQTLQCLQAAALGKNVLVLVEASTRQGLGEPLSQVAQSDKFPDSPIWAVVSKEANILMSAAKTFVRTHAPEATASEDYGTW